MGFIERLPFSRRYLRLYKKLKDKAELSVAFILISADAWKLDALYIELKKHSRFKPTVIVAPFVGKGDVFMKEQLSQCVQLCKDRNYEYLVDPDIADEHLHGLRKNDVFDIVFFTNPNPLTSKKYQIGSFKDSLTCYVPYSFRVDKLYSYDFNSKFVNTTWMNFWETDYHKSLSKRYSSIKGENVRVTGYPQLDVFLKRKNSIAATSDQRKKIVWAPHWTIAGLQDTGLDWSCFLDFESDFLQLADKWRDDIEIALKPHPFLFNLLENTSWGRHKVSAYKKEWERRENCSILLGDYTGLFLSSDALIHDSGSFLVEYLTLDRPSAYTLSAESYDNRFNEVGREAISAHNVIKSPIDLEEFVRGVIDGADDKVNERAVFQNKYLNYDSASKSIVAAMDSSI